MAAGLTFYLTWLVLKVPPNGNLPDPSVTNQGTFLDILKVSLAVVAGTGGAVALVVAYRRQRLSEVDAAALHSRYGAAAKQLGDSEAAVRMAGVYAMEALGREWADRRQQCIDVLCAYLRLPWAESERAVEPHSTSTEHSWPDGSGQRKVVRVYAGNVGEAEVRRTIIRRLVFHLKISDVTLPESSDDWTHLDYDFTGARLPECDFSSTSFAGSVLFTNAQFAADRETSFDAAEFKGRSAFDGAYFSSKYTTFHDAAFLGPVTFAEAEFVGIETNFTSSKFLSNAQFGSAAFRSMYTDFSRSVLTGPVSDFSGMRIGSERSYFQSVRFGSAGTNFNEVSFGSVTTWFDGSAFADAALSFGGSYIGSKGSLSFSSCRFACSRSAIQALIERDNVALDDTQFDLTDPDVKVS